MLQCYALLDTGKEKMREENHQKKRPKKKSHLISLHQEVKTANLDDKKVFKKYFLVLFAV